MKFIRVMKKHLRTHSRLSQLLIENRTAHESDMNVPGLSADLRNVMCTSACPSML